MARYLIAIDDSGLYIRETLNVAHDDNTGEVIYNAKPTENKLPEWVIGKLAKTVEKYRDRANKNAEIFTTVCADHHSDIDVKVFSTLPKAKKYCQNFIRNNNVYGKRAKSGLTNAMIKDGWVYYAEYGTEGDSVRIETSIVDLDSAE